MKTLNYLTIILFGLSIVSCNPDCDQLLTIQVDSPTKQMGDEILITANDPEDLINRQILFATESTSVLATNGRFEESLGGMIFELPPSIQGENVQIQVDDPDCGLISFSQGLSVKDANFFANNPQFIPPSPPEIVIPAPPITFPPLVQNAWVSPQDLDYCIWFKFLPEIVNGDTVMVEVNGQMVPKESNIIDPYNSKEFSVRELVCGDDARTLYHNHSVSGIIDRERNFVNFFIDRKDANGQNLGIEEFEGMFIDIEQAGYMETKVPECNPDNLFDPQKLYLILVRSKQTNRQLLLYQQAFL